MKSAKFTFDECYDGVSPPPTRVPVPADTLHGAARLCVAGPGAVTVLPPTAAVSVALGTAHGGMFHCARCACWDSPLY